MKTLYKIIMLFISGIFLGQEINTELLKAPASPASNLLGVAASEINKPTDVTNLMLGLQNLPFNFLDKGAFALDIAPYWIFPGKKDKSINQMLTNKGAVPQTFVLSFAIKNTDSTSTDLPVNSLYTAVGFKFSIFRGEADETTTRSFYALKKLLREHSVKVHDLLDPIITSDSDIIKWEAQKKKLLEQGGNDPATVEMIMASKEYKELERLIDERGEVLKTVLETSNPEIVESELKIKAVYKKFKINRTGFLWDIAGGTGIQFRNKEFGNSRIYNAGIWTVLGYAIPKAGTPLLLVRYMYNPDNNWMTMDGYERIGNFSILDAGLKYEYSPKDSKFTGSIEGLYRSFVSGSGMKPTWKFVVNLDYMVLPNQHLTLSLGKDFDNTLIKNGNAIAALSLVSGIGSKRSVK